MERRGCFCNRMSHPSNVDPSSCSWVHLRSIVVNEDSQPSI
jgi:hypothetical protein